MKAIPLIARILFSALFINSVPLHFTAALVEWTKAAGVPLAALMVPLTGILELVAAVFLILGYRTRLAGWLFIIFLIPITLAMHQFWTITDPMKRQMDLIHFLKNASLVGAALMYCYFGAGPISLDERINKTGSRKHALS